MRQEFGLLWRALYVLFKLEVGIAKPQSPAKRIAQLESLIALVGVLPSGSSEAKHAR